MLLNVRCVLFPFTIVAFISATLSHFTLDRQCWHERTLFTVNLHSNLDRTQEDAVTIQSNSKQDNFSPWSYPPTCTPFLPSLNSTLCIYTSTTFASGRGISIFTTPALASHYASLPAFLQPSLLTAQHINTHTATWRTQSLPGKGTGVLATRPLHYRDTITAYTPAFLAVLESELSTQDREVYWRQAILQLPETIRDRFLALSTVYGDERVKVQDVVKANTFQLDIQGVNHLAVWPETSRLNHACAPKWVPLQPRAKPSWKLLINENNSAQYVIDPELLTHHVRATRDIAEGEEITIACALPSRSLTFRLLTQNHRHISSGTYFPACRPPLFFPLHLYLSPLHGPCLRRQARRYANPTDTAQRLDAVVARYPCACATPDSDVSCRGSGGVSGRAIWVRGASLECGWGGGEGEGVCGEGGEGGGDEGWLGEGEGLEGDGGEAWGGAALELETEGGKMSEVVAGW